MLNETLPFLFVVQRLKALCNGCGSQTQILNMWGSCGSRHIKPPKSLVFFHLKAFQLLWSSALSNNGHLLWKCFIKVVVLNDVFSNRVISRNRVIPCSPRSQDLKECDYFLVGLPTYKVYKEQYCKVGELKARIWFEMLYVNGYVCSTMRWTTTSGNAFENALININLNNAVFINWTFYLYFLMIFNVD